MSTLPSLRNLAQSSLWASARASSRRETALLKSTRSDWAFVTAGSAVVRPGEISPACARNRRPRSYRGSAPPRARHGLPRQRRAEPGSVLLCRCRCQRSPAEPVAREPNKKTRYGGSGSCRGITEAANLAASAGFRIACMRWLPSPEDLDKTIGGELAIRARDIEMRYRANGACGKG